VLHSGRFQFLHKYETMLEATGSERHSCLSRNRINYVRNFFAVQAPNVDQEILSNKDDLNYVYIGQFTLLTCVSRAQKTQNAHE
jgi:hypothetical protein